MARKFHINAREGWASGTLIVLGLGTMLQASQYNLGRLSAMGPGMFPMILGVLLALLGLLTLITSAASIEDEDEEDFGAPQWRGWGCIIGGIVAFIVLGKWGGLLPATFALVFISALGDRTHTPRSALILAAFVTLIGVVIFSWALSLQFPLLRWG